MVAVDAVVVSYNSREELRAGVEPLSRLAGVNVVVVDNASTDGSLDAIDDLAVTRIALPDNRGFAAGCNVGWREGSSPFVLFLNPDARIDPGSLETLADALVADDGVGLVAPRIVDAEGSISFSMRRFPRLRSTFAQALFLHRVFPNAAWADEVVRATSAYLFPSRPEWVSGACFLIRRTVLERVAGLDERFFLYCEDKDLCRRVRNAGFDVMFEPAALCEHAGGASTPRARLLPTLATSRVRYAHLHRRRPAADVERFGIALGELTHALAGRRGRRQAHFMAFLAVVRGAGGGTRPSRTARA